MTIVHLHRTPNRNHKDFNCSDTERLEYLSRLNMRQRMIARQLKKDLYDGHTVVIPLSNVTSYGKVFIDRITYSLNVEILALESVFEQYLRQEQTQLIHAEKYKVIFGTRAVLSSVHSELWTAVYLVEPIQYISQIIPLIKSLQSSNSIVRIFYDLNEPNNVGAVNTAIQAVRQLGFTFADSIPQRIEMQDIEDCIKEGGADDY